MANDKNFKIKNGLKAGRYLGSTSNVTSATVIDGYNVATATYDNVFTSNSIHGNDNDSRKFFFNDDGTKVFIIGNGSGKIWEYPLSTAYNISSIGSSTSNKSLTSYAANPRGGFFKPDGTRFYSAHLTNDTVGEFTLSTAWDLSTFSSSSSSISLSSNVTVLDDVEFSSDGTKMIVTDGVAPILKTFDLSTAWDVTTASYNSSKTYSYPYGFAGIRFAPDGLKLYIVIEYFNKILIATLSTAYDISTVSSITANDATSFDPTSQNADPYAVDFNSNGTKMYILGRDGNDNIYQYTSGTSTNTKTLDLSAGNTFSFTPSSAVTMIFTNPPSSGTSIGFTLEVVNTGGYALTWPSSIKWHLGTAPTATATKELYAFVTTDGGTTYYGKKAAGDIA